MVSRLDTLGFFLWPLVLSLALVLLLGIGSGWRLLRPGARPDSRSRVWVDATLFWGVFALISGALGAVVGVIRTLQGIEAAGEFLSPLVAPGLVMFTFSLLIGVSILAVAALLWFFLQLRWRLLKAAREEAGSRPEGAPAHPAAGAS